MSHHPYFAESIVRAHDQDVRDRAARGRLAAIARCCRPSLFVAAFRALRDQVTARRVPVCC